MIDPETIVEFNSFLSQGAQYVTEGMVSNVEVSRNPDYLKVALQPTSLTLLQLLLDSRKNCSSILVFLCHSLIRQILSITRDPML